MNAILARLTRLSDPHAPDPALIDAFVAGDEGAFAALVQRHAGLVFATCRRVLRHQQDAEDAFQATFLVLARRAADVWPRDALGAWLFGVAHRVALKARATRERRTARERVLEDVAGAERSPPECDLAEAVHRVVCRLPEAYRAAVVACDLEGLSRKEAAERLGWPEGTLSGRLARARELLATRFRRAGIALPAGGLTAVVATAERAPAATVQATIDLATGGAGTAAGPVAALCEGVVPSMGLIKLKAMAAAVVAVGLIGFGAFAAGGPGGDQKPSQGPGQQQQQQQGAPVATKAEPPAQEPARPKGPRIELARQELEVLFQDIDLTAVSGKLDKDVRDRLRARLQAVDRLLDPTAALTDADRLQGAWRVTSLIEDGKTTSTNPNDPWVIEFAGRTVRMPYREAGGAWKQREYVFALDELAPGAIDLIAPNKSVGRGRYELTMTAKTCAGCHTAGGRYAIPGGGDLPVCPPALKQAKDGLGARLALSIDGKRPEKLGGAGVIVFELRRADPKPAAPPTPPTALLEAEEAAVIAARHVELQRARALLEQAVAGVEVARAQVAKAEAELAAAKKRLEDAKKAAEAKPKPEPAPADAPTYTVHVRSLTAAEKVTRVKLTGTQTVLDALVHADGVALKPDAVSAWVVRAETVLPVDLVGLIKKGETRTNYELKAGDGLFIQAKPTK